MIEKWSIPPLWVDCIASIMSKNNFGSVEIYQKLKQKVEDSEGLNIEINFLELQNDFKANKTEMLELQRLIKNCNIGKWPSHLQFEWKPKRYL